MFIARLETRHFSFTALGRTEAEAREAMAQAWNYHAQLTGAVTFEELGGQDEVGCFELAVGSVARDGETFYTPWEIDGHCTECRQLEEQCACPCVNCGIAVGEHNGMEGCC